MNRSFEGVRSLYTEDQFEKIQKAHILIVGIGGVGSWTSEALVRTGVGEITLVDMDEVCTSNINRQVHALTTNIGQMKTDEMKKRLLLINPELKVNLICDFFTKGNAEKILKMYKYSYVVDAIDSLKNKALLIGECYKQGLPVITVGAAGGMTDPTKIEVRDLNKTVNDKMLKRMRRMLKKDYPEFKAFNKKPYGIHAVSSSESVNYTESESSFTEIRNCKTGYGSVSFVTAPLGFTAAAKIVEELTSLSTKKINE